MSILNVRLSQMRIGHDAFCDVCFFDIRSIQDVGNLRREIRAGKNAKSEKQDGGDEPFHDGQIVQDTLSFIVAN